MLLRLSFLPVRKLIQSLQQGVLQLILYSPVSYTHLPGDQMELSVQVIKERRGVTAFTGIASVNGEVACEAKLMCARR